MALAIVHSRASFGIEAPPVTIEVDLSLGMPMLSIVGLPETAVKESKDRVRSALLNSGFTFPTRRIVINLAPADLPKKDGGRFDLPIALGILAASNQIPTSVLAHYEFAGELALDGTLRPFTGALPFALATKKSARTLCLPPKNAVEAALVGELAIIAPTHLLALCAHLTEKSILPPYEPPPVTKQSQAKIDLADIYGQEEAKRALTIAAAGGHTLLLLGPPGTGKTMLANRLTTILPEISEEEALEVATIHSICGHKIDPHSWYTRPFRTPHHTASSVALVGGATPPHPGEISLAHNGVLFLDELPEFKRTVLEALREPLESGVITISRAAHQAKFPANFQLISAMNPCPCGYLGDNNNNCRCTREQIQRYQARISGPFLDRIDLHIVVPPLPPATLLYPKTKTLTSSAVRTQVTQARHRALTRAHKLNSTLTNSELEQFCPLPAAAHLFLNRALTSLRLSARSYHRIIKIARTIADLENSAQIQIEHLKEALGYRKAVLSPTPENVTTEKQSNSLFCALS